MTRWKTEEFFYIFELEMSKKYLFIFWVQYISCKIEKLHFIPFHLSIENPQINMKKNHVFFLKKKHAFPSILQQPRRFNKSALKCLL